MRKTEGEATLLSKRWDSDLHALRFTATGGPHTIRSSLFVRGFDGWAIYAGTLKNETIEPAELELAERAREAGKGAYLINDESELDPAWLEGAETVFVTAGASAPERLVQALLDRMRREFAVDVEERTLMEEDVTFAPPKSLRSLTVVR